IPLTTLFRAHAEATRLHLRSGFTCSELYAGVGDEVECGDALGDARRVVVARRHDDDAVPEADVLRPLAGGGEEDFRSRGMRVLLEEVVLDLEDVVEAELVGRLDLVQSIL